MFVDAVERAAEFTRPIYSVLRLYGSAEIHRGAATLFFVNSDGWALTAGHVARQLIESEQLVQHYQAFKKECAAARGKKQGARLVRELEQKYRYKKGQHNKGGPLPVEMRNMFVNCTEGPLNFEARLHPDLDVALLKFNGFTRLLCGAFPKFGADGGALKQGKFLCRLGFPFAEFDNYKYDPQKDEIVWTSTGRTGTPRFPIEGMLTRMLAQPGGVAGFEMSTPGLRGQSGGPVFDAQGRVWGLQAATAHLDLDFDVDMEVVRSGTKRHVKESAVLHVGHCIHVDVLKGFMRQQQVAFTEA